MTEMELRRNLLYCCHGYLAAEPCLSSAEQRSRQEGGRQERSPFLSLPRGRFTTYSAQWQPDATQSTPI